MASLKDLYRVTYGTTGAICTRFTRVSQASDKSVFWCRAGNGVRAFDTAGPRAEAGADRAATGHTAVGRAVHLPRTPRLQPPP